MSNTKVYCYILGASGDPDNIKCCVPTLINRDTIFVGPCIHSLRRKIFNDYFEEYVSGGLMEFKNNNQFIIGFNAYNPNKPKTRKIVWAGKITRLMTFEHAYKYFKYNDMDPSFFDNRCSPIHVEPIPEKGEFMGYKHRSRLHNQELKIPGVFKWHKDLIFSNDNKRINKSKHYENTKDKIMLGDGANRKVFNQDCCFVCKNDFFAMGEGIDINNKILNILKDAQPGIKNVGTYAIFGENDKGAAIGKKNSYLEITGILGEELIEHLRNEAEEIPDITEAQFQNYKNRFKYCCENNC